MSFRIRDITIDPNVLLAPMEDVTNAAFRRIVKRIANPGLMFTEFVSAMAIHHGARKTLKKLKVTEGERPLGMQIFGGDPAIMAETARLCEEMGADLVDINMGCWVPKVCKTGAGAALLKDPEKAEKIVEAVVKAVKVPVTVKVRAGYTHDAFAAPGLARRFQDVGAQMITLHARFAKQGFQGEADWRLIAEMRRAVSVPLVGNGDVRQGTDVLRMLQETGCDGVMVGRAAISNPWALRRIIEEAQGLPTSKEPALSERIAVALEHLRLGIDEEQASSPGPGSETAAVKAMRGQLPLYIKGAPGAAAIRNELMKVETYSEVEDILLGYAGALAAAVLEPACR